MLPYRMDHRKKGVKNILYKHENDTEHTQYQTRFGLKHTIAVDFQLSVYSDSDGKWTKSIFHTLV